MEEMIIDQISRSFIKATYKGQQIYIEGEAYLPGYGSPSFVAYLSTLKVSEPKNQTEIHTLPQKEIADALLRAMSSRNQSIEFES